MTRPVHHLHGVYSLGLIGVKYVPKSKKPVRPPRKSARQRMLEEEPVLEAAIDVDLKPRSLKIQPLIRCSLFKDTRVPEIRFSGKWLEKLGFTEKKRIRILPSKGQLILQLEEFEDPENPEGAVSTENAFFLPQISPHPIENLKAGASTACAPSTS
ncbi:MAG: type I toxin-antitoxin system SymE family toxin [Chitinophagaceae bacterium]|jgi:hypothetical protein|nr:type I toxin-antitoxin system SymE family toxin [Chitinophagaceae bacterium]